MPCDAFNVVQFLFIARNHHAISINFQMKNALSTWLTAFINVQYSDVIGMRCHMEVNIKDPEMFTSSPDLKFTHAAYNIKDSNDNDGQQ